MTRAATSRLAAIRVVLRNRRLTSALRGFAAFNIAEQGGWLSILLYAYARGGVAATGRLVVLLLLPAALLAPMTAAAGDRFPRHRVLTVGFLLTGLSLVGTGIAMLSEAPVAVVYGIAVCFSIVMTFGGPAIAAVLPAAAETPDQLTAANVTVGLVQTMGQLVGPILAGVILATASPGWACVWIGALAVLGAVSTIGRHGAAPNELAHPDDPDRESATVEILKGFRLVALNGKVRSLTVMIFLTSVVVGALDVGAAVIADRSR